MEEKEEHHEWVKGAIIVGGAIVVGVAAYSTGVGEVATAGIVAEGVIGAGEATEATAVGVEIAEGAEATAGVLEVGETAETADVVNTKNVSKEIVDGPYVRDGKPYGRPSYKKGQVGEVWENAEAIDGEVRDPNTGKILEWDKSIKRNGQWDMGHIEEEKYFDKWKEYQQGEITKKEFLDWFNDAKNYRPESPSANRSHRYE